MSNGTSASTHVPANTLAASPCSAPETALQAARTASVVMWQQRALVVVHREEHCGSTVLQ